MKQKKGEKRRHEANFTKRLSTRNGVVAVVVQQSNGGGVAGKDRQREV